jgi:hypothetical protein
MGPDDPPHAAANAATAIAEHNQSRPERSGAEFVP